MAINDWDFILEWFLEAHIHILFQIVHFLKKKNLFEPLVRLAEGDVASVGPPVTQFAIFLPIMFTKIFSNTYCYILGDLQWFWGDLLIVGWPWYSLRLLRYDLKLVKQMPGNAIFSRSLLPSVPVLKIHKYTNTQIHKYTNTQIHKYTNTQ